MKTIEVIISEVDRAGADHYGNVTQCIMATTMMNRGYSVRSVSGHFVRIDGMEDSQRWWFDSHLILRHCLPFSEPGPFYKQAIVGTKVTLYQNPYPDKDERNDALWGREGYEKAKAAFQDEEGAKSQAEAVAQEVH